MQKSDINILIVEDDQSQAQSILQAIQKLGYKGMTAKKVDEATSIAKIKPIHGAIIDCMLPDKNGVDLAIILQDHLVDGAPLFLMSGIYRDKAFQADALKKASAIQFFTKPFDVGELMKSVEKSLASFVVTPKVDLHALLAAPLASNRERRKSLDHVEEMYGYDLPFVFCILMDSESSGHLNIVDDQSNIFGVTFAQGCLSKVDSEESLVTVREILKKHGYITENELRELKNKKNNDLMKSLVNESLISPHIHGLIKSEQIINELNRLVTGNRININFVPDRKVRSEEGDMGLSGFSPQLHDMVQSKIPLDYLKSFYSTWSGHKIRLGPNYLTDVQTLNTEIISKVKEVIDLVKKELTIEDLVAQISSPEDDIYRAIHLLAIRRIIVFEEIKRVNNIDEHVNRLKSIYKELKYKNAFEVFEFFGLSRNANPSEYQKAYKEFAKSNHPDTLPQAISKDIKDLNHKLFSKVTEAYEIMMDSNKKEAYLKKLKNQLAEKQLSSEGLLVDAYALIEKRSYVEAHKKILESIQVYASDKAHLYRIWSEVKMGTGSPEINSFTADLENMLAETKKTSLYLFVNGLVMKSMGNEEEAFNNFKRSLLIDENFAEARRELFSIKGASGGKALGSDISLKELLHGDLSDIFSKIFNKKKGA